MRRERSGIKSGLMHDESTSSWYVLSSLVNIAFSKHIYRCIDHLDMGTPARKKDDYVLAFPDTPKELATSRGFINQPSHAPDAGEKQLWRSTQQTARKIDRLLVSSYNKDHRAFVHCEPITSFVVDKLHFQPFKYWKANTGQKESDSVQKKLLELEAEQIGTFDKSTLASCDL